jgi:type I restriction enzyme S subunit
MTGNNSSESTPFPLSGEWKWLSFGAVAKVASNLTKPMDYPSFPHIAPNNIESWTGCLLPFKTVAEDQVTSAKHRFRDGQILYSKIRPNLAKATLVDFEGLCSADMYPIETSLNPQYLLAWMLSPWFTEAATRNQGRNLLPKINVKELSSLPVPVPPPKDQRRIAEIIGQASRLRAERKQAIALLDYLAQSIFLDMFGDPILNSKGWRVATISALSQKVQTGPFGSLLHREDYISGGVPLINPMHIINGSISPDCTHSVSASKAGELASYRLAEGDVVMGRRGEMGRCAVVEHGQSGMLCGTGSLIIRPQPDKAHPRYLATVISHPSAKRRLADISLGSTLPNLNQKIVGNLEISAPPITRQQDFVDRLASLRGVRTQNAAHLADLNELFASVQARAFRNEL